MKRLSFLHIGHLEEAAELANIHPGSISEFNNENVYVQFLMIALDIQKIALAITYTKTRLRNLLLSVYPTYARKRYLLAIQTSDGHLS